jgi:hypothetical protein
MHHHASQAKPKPATTPARRRTPPRPRDRGGKEGDPDPGTRRPDPSARRVPRPAARTTSPSGFSVYKPARKHARRLASLSPPPPGQPPRVSVPYPRAVVGDGRMIHHHRPDPHHLPTF